MCSSDLCRSRQKQSSTGDITTSRGIPSPPTHTLPSAKHKSKVCVCVWGGGWRAGEKLWEVLAVTADVEKSSSPQQSMQLPQERPVSKTAPTPGTNTLFPKPLQKFHLHAMKVSRLESTSRLKKCLERMKKNTATCQYCEPVEH